MNKYVPTGIFYGMTGMERWRMNTRRDKPVTSQDKEKAWKDYGHYLKTFPG